jgi:hypothetical protein
MTITAEIFERDCAVTDYRDCFPFVGDAHSFALKGQHEPASRNAAGNGLNDDFND